MSPAIKTMMTFIVLILLIAGGVWLLGKGSWGGVALLFGGCLLLWHEIIEPLLERPVLRRSAKQGSTSNYG